MPALSIGDCIRYGWETFKQRPWMLIGGFLLAIIISALPTIFGPHPEFGPDGKPIPHPLTVLELVMSFVSIVVSIFVSLGLTNFSLRAHDNIKTVELGDLWNPAPFWRYLIAYVLVIAIVILGIIALIVPGVILAVGLAFVSFLVVDRGLRPIEAIEESWRITKGHKWRLFLLFLALAGINFLGLLALIIGVVVTAPMSLIAMAHAYRTLAR